MKEIYKMWELCCFFEKEKLNMVKWDNRRMDRTFSNTPNTVPEWLQNYQNILEQNREPRTMRAVVIAFFGTELLRNKKDFHVLQNFKNLSKEEKEVQLKINRDLTNANAAYAQFVLSNCIEAGFIQEDEDDQSLIFLTLKGTKFATIPGLLKAYGDELTEIFGAWKLVMTTMIVTVGTLEFEWFWEKILKPLFEN